MNLKTIFLRVVESPVGSRKENKKLNLEGFCCKVSSVTVEFK